MIIVCIQIGQSFDESAAVIMKGVFVSYEDLSWRIF